MLKMTASTLPISPPSPIHLDLSEGSEPVVQVAMLGWPQDRKQLFLDGARELQGVSSASSAGGFTSVHVRYDPSQVDGRSLSDQLSRLSHRLAASEMNSSIKLAPMEPQEGHTARADSVGNVLNEEHDEQSMSELAAPPSLADGIHSTSSWTGISTPRDRAKTLRLMVPSVLGALDALIASYELGPGSIGHNYGPPLEDRAEALTALRELHSALGLLLAATEQDNDVLSGEGMIADGKRALLRVKAAVGGDIVPFAIAGMVEALFGIMGWHGSGLATIMVLEGRSMQRKQ